MADHPNSHPIKLRPPGAGTLAGAQRRLATDPALRLRAIQAQRANKGPGGPGKSKAAARLLTRRKISAEAEIGRKRIRV